MKQKQNVLINSVWAWILCGLCGFLLFFGLKDHFDFMTNAPVSYSKESAIEQTLTLFRNLEIDTDTLGIVPFRLQRVGLYTSVRDSLEIESSSLRDLNRNNFFLHGWDIIVARPIGINESFNLTANSIYDTNGFIRVRWNNQGKLRLLEIQPDRGDPPFKLGENSLNFASELVSDIFGYDLNNYELADGDFNVDESDYLNEEQRRELIQTDEEIEHNRIYRWEKSGTEYVDIIEIELQTAVHEEGPEYDRTVTHGVTVNRFEAFNEAEKIPLTESNQNFTIFFLITIVLIMLFVFIEGFGQLFKGKVDWNRILLIAFIISLFVYGWRFLYLLNFTDLLPGQVNIILHFNMILYGLVMGIFAGIAYLGWEAYARGQKRFQIELIDAFWRGKFFVKETGNAIIKGFSLGSFMLGITALFLTISGLILYQFDSQFGFTEIVNRPFFVSINMSIFVVASLCSVAMIGLIYNFLHKRLKNHFIIFCIAVLIGGGILAGLGRTFGTDGTVLQDLSLFLLLAIPLFLAYQISGIVTVFSGMWIYSSIILTLPYFGSVSPDVALNAWLQIAFATSILLFGIAAYRYAPSIRTISSYIPEYEKKMIRSLRFENEILIARKTQEKLMPLTYPQTDHYELYGYFLPSYEVGGDYFDYVSEIDLSKKQFLTFTVVDVSGKSMRAAMHAVFTSGLLRSRMYTDQPSKILREISPVIHEKTDAQTFITCIIGRFEPEILELTLSNAGHCLPMIKRDGRAEFLEMPDPKFPLGVRSHVDYNDLKIKLQPGDTLLFYSDGFPEAVNGKGERFGFENALKIFEEMDSGQMTSKEICNHIRNVIQEFSIERLADDTTILCLKVK